MAGIRPARRPTPKISNVCTITACRRSYGGSRPALGRLTTRDVRFVRETRWTLMARAGDTESGKVLRWDFDSELKALQTVDRLLRADTACRWREQDRGTPPPTAGTEWSAAGHTVTIMGVTWRLGQGSNLRCTI
jgi:hypothetical protein